MNIAIIGYGVEGKSLAQYMRRHGHKVTICDEKPRGSINKLTGLHLRFGPHYLSDLGGFDMVFRSPGVPLLKKEFQTIKNKLTTSTKYFFEKCPCPIVGVTGTKGKGTTATLIYEMLKANFEKMVNKAWLGGNIGQSPMDFLDQISKHDVVVLELSSFQLQDLDKSPHVAVVLGISEDHMDYHADMEEYIDAKKHIVRFQSADDFAILDKDNGVSTSFSKDTKAKILQVSTEGAVDEGGFLKVGKLVLKHGQTGMIVGETSDIKMIGRHNLKNILAAATVASVLKVPVEVISKVVREFSGLPHRLEFIAESGGVKYFNDSASTNPHTAIAALRAFTEPVILIAGGSDKNANFAPLGHEIANRHNVKTVVLMGQTKPKIERAIEDAVKAEKNRREVPLELINSESYQEAFMVSKMLAAPGDVVLLSPACASFDMFSNYQERGEIFRNFVMS